MLYFFHYLCVYHLKLTKSTCTHNMNDSTLNVDSRGKYMSTQIKNNEQKNNIWDLFRINYLPFIFGPEEVKSG